MIINKRISFDFDGTLDDHFDGSINSEKDNVRKLLLDLSKDNTIYIITKRYAENYIKNIDEASKVFEVAEQLGLGRDRIRFTNRELKIAELRRNNIDIHFDDDQYELSIYHQICKVINIGNPNWREEFIYD